MFEIKNKLVLLFKWGILKLVTKSGLAFAMVFIVIAGSFTGIAALSSVESKEIEEATCADEIDESFDSQANADIQELENPVLAEAEEEVSFYDSVAIAQVDTYVNVRSGPGTDNDIVGIIRNDCAATIISEEDGWYKIESGNVEGYISAEYFLVGDEAEKKAREVGYVDATVTADVLNVRDGQSTDSAIITSLIKGQECDVIKYGDEWVYLLVDGTKKGWVSMEYVTIDVTFETALTLEEEAERVAEEAAALAAEQAAQTSYTTTSTKTTTTYTYEETEDKAQLRAQVVDYALKWVGITPYSHGLDLYSGTDCSGFTLLVYQKFGYSLPRSSSAYGSVGTTVPLNLNNLLPGDILYSYGHVAIYIGNGQIVHARRPGVKVSVQSWTVCSWSSARRIIN